MGRLLGMLSAAVVYLCVATVITLVVMLGYAYTKGFIDKDKLNKMAAVAQGIDTNPTAPTPPINAAGASAEIVKQADTHEQPSLDELEMRRAIQTRHLELREQAVQTQMEQLRADQSKLTDDKQTYDRQKAAFEKQLAALHDGAQAAGRDNIRIIWESIKPKQAKDQIIQMIDAREQDDVVAILTAMPVTKRAKIIGEFKSDEETKKLDDILDLIRQGMPEEKVINKTQQQLTKASPTAAN
jgi:hypothetical protein